MSDIISSPPAQTQLVVLLEIRIPHVVSYFVCMLNEVIAIMANASCQRTMRCYDIVLKHSTCTGMASEYRQ